jgi:hypothetical protein
MCEVMRAEGGRGDHSLGSVIQLEEEEASQRRRLQERAGGGQGEEGGETEVEGERGEREGWSRGLRAEGMAEHRAKAVKRLPRPYRGDPAMDDAFHTIIQWLHSKIPDNGRPQREGTGASARR